MSADAALVAIVGVLLGALLGPSLAGWSAVASQRGLSNAGRPHAPVARATRLAASALAASTFGAIGWRWGHLPELIGWWWLAATGCVLALVDWRTRRLPFRETTAMAAGTLTLLAAAASPVDRWERVAGSAAAGAVVLLLAVALHLLAPAHTGGGDTVLYGALAACLGWLGWLGVLRGLLLGAIATALVGAVTWARHGKGSTIPAGPTLIAGSILAIALTSPECAP